MKFMFDGKIRVRLSDIDPTLDNKTMKLGSKVGYRLELPFAYRYDSQWSLLLVPWGEYSRIGRSNAVPVTVGGQPSGSAILEPASRTVQYGVNVGILFEF